MASASLYKPQDFSDSTNQQQFFSTRPITPSYQTMSAVNVTQQPKTGSKKGNPDPTRKSRSRSKSGDSSDKKKKGNKDGDCIIM